MITNFEEITKELSPQECELLPLLIKGFLRHGKNDPIKAPDIIKAINAKRAGKPLTEVRLRKLCNFIRNKGMIPLIATSHGYYTSSDPDEIQKQIKSLEERAGSIMAAADGLRRFL